ncbi:MAG: AAA family ATPase [Victivallales bacterium]|nr:AAA family ATPase [Victivallales bacterium]
MPKPILIDTNSFRELREKHCVYVDKTAYLRRLAVGPNARFFLARPRRFGKSVMISTLQALFEARKELFEDLAIEKEGWEWEKYPVMHFNLSFAASCSLEEFKQNFPATVRRAILKAGGEYDPSETPSVNFGLAIEELSAKNKGKGVVILIDEYDDPVARLLHKTDEAQRVREILAGFYGQMKDRADCTRFLMITGVSKFTKMSVFSAVSNLIDLSFEDDCATMLGYTEEELDEFFDEHLHAHAKIMGMEYSAYRAELKRWFNGYRFGQCSEQTVYNPVSLGMNLYSPKRTFSNYWTTTGKASMLMNFLRRDEYLSVDLENVSGVAESDFDMTDLNELRTVPMLYQTGYLTIADYNPYAQAYDLRVPDEEVRQDLATLTAAYMSDRSVAWVTSLGKQLLTGKWESFLDGLKALYAALPYGPRETRVQEFSYARALMTLLRSQGVQCRVEEQ